MTTEDLRSQISQIIRASSEMYEIIRVDALIAVIAAGIALLAMEAGILGIPDSGITLADQSPASKTLIPMKARVGISPEVPATAGPKPIPYFVWVLLIGGYGLISFVPAFAIWACIQHLSNKNMRKRADKAANLILDAWANPTSAPLRVTIALVTQSGKVEIDDEKVSRVLAVLGTSAVDPSVWGQARGNLLRTVKIP